MSSPHQQVVSSIQSSHSFSNVGRSSEPAAGLLNSAGKQATIAPLRDPRDASKKKKTTDEDVKILAQQGLYAAAAENIRNEAKEFAANAKHQQQIADGMKRPSSAQVYKNVQSTINNGNNNNNRSSSMTPQPQSSSSNANHANVSGINSSSASAHNFASQQRSPFVSRFSSFSPLDLVSGISELNNNNQSMSNNDTEGRHDTLVSSGRAAYVKKRASSAKLLPGNSVSSRNNAKPPSVADAGNNKITASTNISKIGRKTANNNNSSTNKPIVEALYTPDIEIDRRFLVKERLREKQKREGQHIGELSSFKSVPRPEAGDESLSYGGIAKTSKQKLASRKPPPVGAYNPHYETREHKVQGFYFDAPSRTYQSPSQKQQQQNNSNHDPSSLVEEYDEYGNTILVDQNHNNNNNNNNNNNHNRTPSPGSRHHQQQQNPNSISQQFGSLGTFDLINTSTMNFASMTSAQAEASFRGLKQDSSGAPGIYNSQQKYRNEGQQNKNRHAGRASPDLENMAKEQQQKLLEEQLMQGKRIPTPEHMTFSKEGTASFASKAPRFSTDSNKRDKQGNLVPPPPPPESPYPIVKMGSAVRPTGGGAIGAPLGTYTTPPDLPQKHSVARSRTPQHNNNNNNTNTSASVVSSSMISSSTISPTRGQQQQQHQKRSTPTPTPIVKMEAKVRRTFLDDLKAPGYSERLRADDVAIRPRMSCGVSFDKAAGRYGHSIKTAASLRFQPIRSVGRTADEEEVALKASGGGGGNLNSSHCPQEKFLDTSMVSRVNTKDDTEVLSTKHRVHTGLTFDKQHGNHTDKHSVVAGGDQKTKPSSVMASQIPLEHPFNSFTNSRIPGYVSLDKKGGGPKKNSGNYRKVNVFGDDDPIAAMRAKQQKQQQQQQNDHDENSTKNNNNKDKTFLDLSYPRSRSAIVLRSATEGHQDPAGGVSSDHNNYTSSSPSRFKFHQQNITTTSTRSPPRREDHHQNQNNNKPLDDFRHVRSPSAFFPKTSHESYIVTRSDGSGPTGKNVTKNNLGIPTTTGVVENQIPLERLRAAEQATQPKTKGLFDISKTLSREDRDRRWNSGALTKDGKNDGNIKKRRKF